MLSVNSMSDPFHPACPKASTAAAVAVIKARLDTRFRCCRNDLRAALPGAGTAAAYQRFDENLIRIGEIMSRPDRLRWTFSPPGIGPTSGQSGKCPE